MNWQDKIFRYCERGQDAGFWAEPLNALTNIAFLLAALAALIEIARRGSLREKMPELLLALVVLAIGVGSFLFHTYATRWAALADTAPIGVFMIAYVAYALRYFAGASWMIVAAVLATFLAAMKYAGGITCGPALLPITAAQEAPCLNGSAGYLPAVATLILVSAWLAAVRHPAARLLVSASAVLMVSISLRTLDIELCALTEIAGRRTGTHFLWHVLNAVTLYLLLAAAIRHGRRGAPDTLLGRPIA